MWSVRAKWMREELEPKPVGANVSGHNCELNQRQKALRFTNIIHLVKKSMEVNDHVLSLQINFPFSTTIDHRHSNKTISYAP